MELKDLIIKYYNSNDKTEKLELRNEVLKKKTELNLPIAFEYAVKSHYDGFLVTGSKGFLEVMLKYAS